MPISHAKSITVADATGTVTGWFGTSTVTIAASAIQLPSDWNSAHAMLFTLTGNTTQNSTVSGTNVMFAGSGGISVGGTSGTIVISAGVNATVSTFVPYFPASTSSQTLGAFGTSTASAMVFPIIFPQDVAFNHIKILQSGSIVTTTQSSGLQTITSRYGLYSNNAGTLSEISTGSFSIALTLSSISGTISFPTSTGTAGYGYNTSTWNATNAAQSLFGTAGNRVIDLVFSNSMSRPPGVIYLGLHQRQSTSNFALGLSSALVGNAMNATSGAGPFGRSTAAFSNSSDLHLGAHGFYTSTGSAGYSGTNIPASMILTAFNNNLNVMPMVTFASS
jgi:hypothetical protein